MRCNNMTLGNILIFGVGTKQNIDTIVAHENTWASHPSSSVVWYTDALYPKYIRCSHFLQADDNVIRRRIHVIMHVMKWYFGLFKWYTSIEYDNYIYLHSLHYALGKHSEFDNIAIGRVHNFIGRDFINGGSGTIYSTTAFQLLAHSIQKGKCPSLIYKMLKQHDMGKKYDVVISFCSSIVVRTRLVSLCGFRNVLPTQNDILSCTYSSHSTTEKCQSISFNMVKTPQQVNHIHTMSLQPCLLT